MKTVFLQKWRGDRGKDVVDLGQSTALRRTHVLKGDAEAYTNLRSFVF